MSTHYLGFDVGGSSIKAAVVDTATGAILRGPDSVPLPLPSTPERVVEAALAMDVARGSAGRIGLAFPSVVSGGRARTAANVDPSWVDAAGGTLVEQRSGRPCTFLNDADAAGLAEMRFGAGRDLRGVVFILTFGSGIGSAPFVDGRLMPNTELGHMHLAGVEARDAEDFASARTRTRLALDWPAWTARVNVYLAELHRLFWPDAFILGGAVSERFDEWGGYLVSPARILPAQLRGHALAAAEASLP
jgi:polyphosphate glucokinase